MHCILTGFIGRGQIMAEWFVERSVFKLYSNPGSAAVGQLCRAWLKQSSRLPGIGDTSSSLLISLPH